MRRLVFFLAVNAIVSVMVTLSVLWIWDSSHRGAAGLPPAPTAGPGTAGAPGEPPAEASTLAPGETPGAAVATSAGLGGGPEGLATITPTVYVVQTGDTLGKIADQFGVSVEDLMAANGLTDPNVLDVGQALNIPFGDFLPPTLTAEPPTAEPAAATVEGGTQAPPATSANTGTPQLAIRGIAGSGDPEQERVTIVNVGGDVSLAGWTMHDEQGSVFFFPALSLFQGGAVTVHTKTGQNTVTDLYWNQTASIWEPGETATLVDPTGAEHTTFVVP